MKFQVIKDDVTKLLIHNKYRVPGVVLIFPITRAPSPRNESWPNFVRLIQESKLYSIVIFDKTQSHAATSFFLKQDLDLDCYCYIVQRDPLEGIFDSQKVISLDPNLWIIQVHDDDGWLGRISLPDQVFNKTIYVPTIRSGNKEYDVSESISVPAHTLFSLIPANLWNSFTDYIDAQGGHIAPSADSSLSLIAKLQYKHERLAGFTYIYSDRHWDNRLRIRSELRKLSRMDGWGELSGSTSAVLTAHVDQICFSLFVANEETVSFNRDNLNTLVKQIASSKKSKLFRLIPTILEVNMTNRLIGFIKATKDISLLSKLISLILLSWLGLKVSKVHDLRTLNELLKQIRRLNLSDLLNMRLDYWIIAITKSINN
jgi:hypothetical protein